MNTKCMMKIVLAVVLISAVSAHAAYFEDWEAGTSIQFISTAPFNWTTMPGHASHYIQSGTTVDPDGLALSGGTWAQWSGSYKVMGFAAPDNDVSVFETDAFAQGPGDGAGGNPYISHWGRWGVGISSDPTNSLVRWEVNDTGTGGFQGLLFDASGIGGSNVQVAGSSQYLGNVFHLQILVDRLNEEVWGTIDDGITLTTTAKQSVTTVAIDTWYVKWLNANAGAETAVGLELDNLSATPEPVTVLLLGLGGLSALIRRRRA